VIRKNVFDDNKKSISRKIERRAREKMKYEMSFLKTMRCESINWNSNKWREGKYFEFERRKRCEKKSCDMSDLTKYSFATKREQWAA
jgi:hypothetical protein